MLSFLFFVIIYGTMQKVGYIKFEAQPDLTTVITYFSFLGDHHVLLKVFLWQTSQVAFIWTKKKLNEISKNFQKMINLIQNPILWNSLNRLKKTLKYVQRGKVMALSGIKCDASDILFRLFFNVQLIMRAFVNAVTFFIKRRPINMNNHKNPYLVFI